MTWAKKAAFGSAIFLSGLFAYEANAQSNDNANEQNIQSKALASNFTSANDPVKEAEEKLVVVKFGDGTDAQDYSLETGSTVMSLSVGDNGKLKPEQIGNLFKQAFEKYGITPGAIFIRTVQGSDGAAANVYIRGDLYTDDATGNHTQPLTLIYAQMDQIKNKHNDPSRPPSLGKGVAGNSLER